MDTVKKGDELEGKVFEYFEAMILADSFVAKADCCRIFTKKGYYSRDRQSDIVFDVSVEIGFPGDPELSLLYLIECKNYAGRVPVDDIEEFLAKVDQVGSAKTKAVVVSAQGFQRAAIDYAKAKGVGLMRFFGPEGKKWLLKRSPAVSVSWAVDFAPDDGEALVALEQPSYTSEYFDWCCLSPNGATNSVNRFFWSLVMHSTTPEFGKLLEQVVNTSRPPWPMVPFLEVDEVEAKAQDVHDHLGYSSGAVDLVRVCDWQTKVCDLQIEIGGSYHEKRLGGEVLGTFSKDPPKIEVFESEDPHRDRFTLAHELGHHILGHSAYLEAEYTQERDFSEQPNNALRAKEIRRMEWQANSFASCLLLPRERFLRLFIHATNQLQLRDRGFGPLFVDDQRINLHNFYSVTNRLKSEFDVSRTVVMIRLEQLRLLNDSRHSPRRLQTFLGFRED